MGCLLSDAPANELLSPASTAPPTAPMADAPSDISGALELTELVDELARSSDDECDGMLPDVDAHATKSALRQLGDTFGAHQQANGGRNSADGTNRTGSNAAGNDTSPNSPHNSNNCLLYTSPSPRD